jgi:hypothetical protein
MKKFFGYQINLWTFSAIVLILSLILIFLNIQPSAANSIIVLNPTQDVYTMNFFPNTNFENETRLIIPDGDFDEGVVLLKFDLSSIPNNAIVNNATLQLYVRGNVSDGGFPTTWGIDIFRPTTSWNSNTVTYNTLPNKSPNKEANINIGTTIGIYYSTNLSDLVSSWINGSIVNRGLYIEGGASCQGCSITFDSSEGTFKPRLIIDFVVPVTTIITPSDGGTLTNTDPGGDTTTVVVPPNAVTQNTTLIFISGNTSTNIPPNFNFAGQAFSLNAEQNGLPQQGFSFNQPINITIGYNDVDVAGLNENTLIVSYLDTTDDTWKDAATTCTPTSVYNRQPSQNRLSVKVCHLTDFALFEPNLIFLPLIVK